MSFGLSKGWDHMNDALGYLVYWRKPVNTGPSVREKDRQNRVPLLSSFSRFSR